MPPMAPATTDSSSAAAARRFAVACGVLSQFVKAAGPVPMSMPMSAYCAAARYAGAVQEPHGTPADGAQQLTIFYGGRVVVLDGCTPARAAELIRYAAAAAAIPPAETPATALVNVPIVRKASLKRFLSKRKDRSVAATAEAPSYRRTEESAAAPPAKKGKTEASSWLALGCLGDMHAQ